MFKFIIPSLLSLALLSTATLADPPRYHGNYGGHPYYHNDYYHHYHHPSYGFQFNFGTAPYYYNTPYYNPYYYNPYPYPYYAPVPYYRGFNFYYRR